MENKFINKKIGKMNINKAKKVLKDAGYIGIDCLFHKDDIISTSNDIAMPLDDKQVQEVIEEIDRIFDPQTKETYRHEALIDVSVNIHKMKCLNV